MKTFQRRKFIQAVCTTAAVTATGGHLYGRPATQENNSGNRFRISLNAYSFNAPLSNQQTTLEDVMEFCARTGFDAIDITGYYMPGYPVPPSDEYLHHLKRRAHALGLGISGTGIRNEFAEPDAGKRKTEIRFVQQWIDVAAKLGAPVLRIFTGKTQPVGYSRAETETWIVEAVKECALYAQQQGVILAMQNHNDFVKTADQAISILSKVNSEWFGLVLDTGSFVTEEPYGEIRKTTGYAVNWQIKERLNYQGRIEDMDLDKLCSIIHASAYRGYLPIETLSPGDPFTIVPPFLQKVKRSLEKTAVQG